MNNGTITEINALVNQLEQGMRTQSDTDIAYNGWCNLVKSEMYDKLSYKTVHLDSKYVNKRNKSSKPWWNVNLTLIFKDGHDAERKLLKCNVRSDKIYLKQQYVATRKRLIEKYKDVK